MLPILFEDDFILAVDKPSGLPSHSLGPDDEENVEKLLLKQRSFPDLHLLHRLDNGTSGVLLFAKSKAAYEAMRERFQNRKIQKNYLAFAEKPEISSLKEFTFPHRIDTPLAHHPKSKKRMIVLPPGLKREYRGKPLPALTFLKSAEKTTFQGKSAIRFEVEILTGVTHQIRVHLASIGYPLIGDAIYGKKTGEGETLPRLGLHAESVQFELNGFQYQIHSKLK